MLCLLPTLMNLLKRDNHHQIFTKACALYKNLILYHRTRPSFRCLIEPAPNSNRSLFQTACESLLVKMLNPKEPEINCQLCGNFFMSFAEFFMQKRSPQMLTALIRKLNKCSLPASNQGIVVYLSFLIQSYSPDMLMFLNELQVDNKHGLKVLMDHWLLHQPKFAGNLSKLHTSRGLVHIYR